jgi:hypothetical protein
MRTRHFTAPFLGLLLLVVGLSQPSFAQTEPEGPSNLETRVDKLEHKTRAHANEGAALFLFGAFCALWAQNTGRNPWLWFFMGLLFSVITVLVLLSKNSEDRKQRLAPTQSPPVSPP